MITEITYYDPRQKRTRTETLNNAEDWRVQAMVQKLRREGKVIRDVRSKGQRAAIRSSDSGSVFDCDLGSLLENDNGSRSEDEVHTGTCEPD